jgi:hypothetical protein
MIDHAKQQCAEEGDVSVYGEIYSRMNHMFVSITLKPFKINLNIQ